MTKFDDYRELFAEDGNFDVPANFSVGMALKATDKLDISFDFQRIFYSDVNAIGNRGPVAGPFGPTPTAGSGLLGADNGLGFAWNDINVYRIGLQYELDSQWTIRSGFSWNDTPVSNKEILFNILAPAVIKKHATFAISYAPTLESEFTIGYMHGFKETQKARTAFGVPAKIEMKQNAIEVGYSWKF
jgi:long-chain fatty acid transport protein